MSIKKAWTENRIELVASLLLSIVGAVAIAEALRLHFTGPSAADWTAGYVGFTGSLLIFLAFAALGSSSRVAAENTVTARIASDILADVDDEEVDQMREVDLPKEQVRSLLTRTIVLLILWAAAVSIIGYVITTALFIIGYGLLVSKRKLFPAVTLSAIATAAFYATFHLSGIILPSGLLF